MMRLAQRELALKSRYAIGVLGAVCVFAAGCSNSIPTRGRDSSHEVNRARVGADGHEINLRASDVPGFVVAKFPRSRVMMAGPFGANIEKCDGVVVNVGEVSGMTSSQFKKVERHPAGGVNLTPREDVGSAVYVMSGSTLAHRAVAAFMSSRGLQCVERSFVATDIIVKPEGAEPGVPLLTKIGTSNIRSRIDGMRIEGLRTTAHDNIEGTSISDAPNYYQDLWAIAVGRTVITLLTIGSPQPFPAAEAQRLLSILYDRSRSTRLSDFAVR
jgi:hypothetical protein